MNFEGFRVIIANDCEREKVFAEIYYKNELWAEISQETDLPIICFFSPLTKKYWEFPLKEALDALEFAKTKLLGKEPNKCISQGIPQSEKQNLMKFLKVNRS